ncbi:MAG: protein kinase domain-containing protein [Acidobacteriota bacterium]
MRFCLSRHPFTVVVCGMTAVALLYIVFAVSALWRYGGYEKDFGWQFKVVADHYELVAKDETLRRVDGWRLVSINGDARLFPTARDRMIWLHLRDIVPGQPYTLQVAHGAEIQELTLTAVLRWQWKLVWQAVAYALVALSFLAFALFLGFLRPEDKLARLAAIAAFTTAPIPSFRMLEPLAVMFSPVELALLYSSVMLYPMFLAFAVHFYACFPLRARLAVIWRPVVMLGYVLGALIGCGYRWLDWVTLRGRPQAIESMIQSGDVFRLLDPLALVYLVASFVVLVTVVTDNYRRLREPDERRRIKWIIYGTLIGIAPFAVLTAVEVIFEAYRGVLAADPTYQLLTFFSEITYITIPVTLGYAIIRHRLFDVRVIVRRGVQYALAKRALTALVIAPLAWLVLMALLNTHLTIRELFLTNPLSIALGILAAFTLRFRAPLQQWVDRRFFRDQYDREQLLIELPEQLKQQSSLDDLTELVTREITDALHPKSFRVVFLATAVGQETLAENQKPSRYLSLPERSPLANYMQLATGAQDVPLPPEVQLSAFERSVLEQAQAALLVPMKNADGRLVGLMMLGEKQSEEPYSALDRQTLQAIGVQIGIIHDNTQLRAQVERVERMRREVLARLDEQAVNLVKECPVCGRCYDANVNLCADDRAELTLSLPVERVIEGKYRLDKLLGKGGMGAVYLTHDLRLNRSVAVKVILAHLFGDAAALRRFEREARVAAALRHPNLVAVYDFGRTGADGAYLVMEVVKGCSMRAELRMCGKLDGLTAALWFDQIFEGLKAAHAAGIVHRDLKPENVVICREEETQPVIKVLDFGLAKSNLEDGQTITRPDVVMGTVGYMAPEQALGGDALPSSDVFSLAVMLVEALTGDIPFPRRNFSEYVIAVKSQAMHWSLGVTPEAKGLERIIRRALSPEPTDRYVSAAEFQAAVIPALRLYAACPGAPLETGLSDDAPTLAAPTRSEMTLTRPPK